MAVATGTQSTTQSNLFSVRVITGLFLVLGVGSFLLLIAFIRGNPEIGTAPNAGQTILAFLNSLGIVLPLLLIFFGVYFIRLASRLNQRDYIAASWAQVILFWLIIGAIIVSLINLPNALVPEATSEQWLPVVAFLLLAGLCAYGWYWLGVNKETTFEGGDTLSSRDARLAWNLLIPTLVVLILVAARPLERTFIASLTNQEFAGTREVEFVGLDNYAALLGIRLDRLPTCADDIAAEARGCDEEGVDPAATYPSALRFLRDNVEGYGDLRYRVVREYDILGSRYVFSARDQNFIASVENTLFFTVFSVILELALGMGIALVVNSKFPGRGLMRAAMLVPWAIPTVVSARLWEAMLRDNMSGVVNNFWVNIGVMPEAQAWLANPDLQIWSLIFVDVWKTTPFMALLILAGLQTIPGDIYEAAEVDGAGKVRQFFTMTLPLLRPTIAVALVFRTLDAVRAFDVFDVLIGKQLQSMSTYNSQVLVENQEFGYASAVGVTIFVIILIFTIIYVRSLGIGEEE